MYELIISDFLNLKSIIRFLKDINKLDILKSEFGIIDCSKTLKDLYALIEKSKRYNINLKINESRKIKIEPPSIAEKIEIKNDLILINQNINIEIRKIKALILHFIKEPVIKQSPFITAKDAADLISMDVGPYIELIYEDNKRIIIKTDVLLINKSSIYALEPSIEINLFNLADYLINSNDRIIAAPVYKIYKENNNYVKYFIKELFDDKEFLWMIKNRILNI